MTHASLFSGIGGFDLAAEWAGWTNAFNCEVDPFCQKILKYHFLDAKQYGNIKTTDFAVWRGRIDVLTGGFPCQPFSLAGKRQGTNDARYLWPAMLDVIRVIRPRWVVGENVFGIVNWSEGMVFERVCSDLEAEGYEVRPYIIPACGVGAPHRRDRCWFIAHRTDAGVETVQRREDGVHALGVVADADCNRCRIGTRQSKSVSGSCRTTDNRNGSPNGTVADTYSQRCNQFNNSSFADQARQPGRSLSAGTAANASRLENNRRRPGGFFAQSARVAASEYASDTQSERFSERDAQPCWNETHPATQRHDSIPNWDDFPTQSPVRGRNDGFPGGLDGITIPKWRNQSIKAYGNAIVPQVALQIFETINEIEKIFRPWGE